MPPTDTTMPERRSSPAHEPVFAENNSHALEQFAPETGKEQAATYAVNAGLREREHPDDLPPLLILRKAGAPTPEEVVSYPPTSAPQLLMSRARDAWERTAPMRARGVRVVADLWTSLRWPDLRRATRVRVHGLTRERLEPAVRLRRIGRPPMWLVGSVAFMVPALMMPRYPNTPVRPAELQAAVSTPPLERSVPDRAVTAPIPSDEPQAIPASVSTAEPAYPRPPVSITVERPVQSARAVQAPAPKPSLPLPVPEPPKAPRVPANRAYLGTLLINSDPIGAIVFVDQRRVGETPLELPGVRAGSHAIRVESEGYVRWTAGVLVRFNSVTRVEPKLERRSDR